MEDVPIYQLIHAVDPTKIKVPIREKFAKLTLSSTKKKKDEPQQKQSAHQVEKRQSASRNLIDELLAVKTPSSESIEKTYLNPIFRSDSSSSRADDKTILNIDGHTISDEHANSIEESEFMEPLQITADLSWQRFDFADQIQTITEKVSNLDVDDPIIVVGSTQDMTQLVSTESQKRVSSSRLSINALQKPIKCEINQNISICISSSDETYNDNDEEIEAITISDSSGDFDEPTFDYDIATSNIPATGETVDLILPETFSNDKADRLEAFLRDVSFERKEMEKNGHFSSQNIDDTVPNSDMNRQSINVQIKAKEIAGADTESMSGDLEYTSGIDEIQELTDRKNRLLALEDTVALSNTHASLNQSEFQAQSQENPKYKFIRNESPPKCNANDDTEANTLISEKMCSPYDKALARSSGSNSIVNSSFKSIVPEDSILVPETSSELENDINTDSGRVSTPANELVSSENRVSEDNSPLQVHLSQIQMGMASINISAQINIKIQISHQLSSDNEQSSIESNDGNDNDEAKISLPPSTNSNVEQVSQSVKHHQQQMDVNELVDSTSSEEERIEHKQQQVQVRIIEETEDEEDEKFMTHAEKLLNQLYGNSWQTPEVIKTLKRTSKSAGKSKEKTYGETLKVKEQIQKNTRFEESKIDDFSIFRRNIVRTNLDSTRLATPQMTRKCIENIETEPRKLPMKTTNRVQNNNNKVSQTEIKPKRGAAKKTSTTQRGRTVTHQRWRQLLDNDTDSDGINASDDDDINCTDKDFSIDSKSDHSWSKSDLSGKDSDSDIDTDTEMKNRNTRSKQNKNTTRSRQKTVNSKAEKWKLTSNKNEDIIYLDLSKEEISVAEGTPSGSPPVNHDEKFNNRLADILRTCQRGEKPKLEATPNSGKTKRKLFNANFGEEDDITMGANGNTPKNKLKQLEIMDINPDNIDIIHDLQNVNMNEETLPRKIDIFNKHLEAIKTGKPIFQLTPPRSLKTPNRGTPLTVTKTKTITTSSTTTKTPKTTNKYGVLSNISDTPNFKYGFLKSLDVCVSKSFCHPDALIYRDNYNKKKEELGTMLYELYNVKLFNNALNVPLVWHKKLSSTAGRCLNKKKMGTRTSIIELSEKVLTSADRLRCTLIHELCHAATWIFNGEGGHGSTWKQWARRANDVFPELPKIGVCHQYDIEYKYTYKCTLCSAKSHAHSKSKKVENIRCSYCHGAIEIFLNKKDKYGNIVPMPVKEATGFAKFVQDNYKKFKRPELKHADVMKILSNEFAALKIAGK